MIRLKYDSWEKISVNVFEKLNNAIESAEVTGNEMVDYLNKQVAILSVLCDVDEDRIVELNKNDFADLVKQSEFLNETPKKNIIDKVTLNGKEYEIFLSIGNMNMNQLIDFHTLYKDKEKNFKQMLAIFILPKGKAYCEGYDIKEVIDDIGEYLSITDANNIMFFFALAYQSLTKVILTSLVKEMKKMKKKEENQERVKMIEEAIMKIQEAQSLAENGVGHIM